MKKSFFRLLIPTVFIVVFSINASFSQRISPKDKVTRIHNDTLLVIDKIHIIGNKKTKEPIITRELGFKEGDSLYSSRIDAVLEASRNNVYNTQLFSTVEITKLMTDSAHLEILVEVEERWYFYPSLVFRLIDRNFNDWWVNRDHDFSRVKYGIKLEQYNFRGRKEKLKLIALFGYENWFLLNYEIPYIDKGQNHGLAFGVGYQNNNNVAFQTNNHVTQFLESQSQKRGIFTGSVTYTYRPSFYNYNYLTLSGYHATISDTIADLNQNYFGNGDLDQRAFKLSYIFQRDVRDNRKYPLKGYMAYGEVEKVGLGIFKDVDIWRFTANYNHYFDLGNNYYFSASLGGQITSKDAPYFNYTQMGFGTYYVRGYELDLIEGPHNVLSKNTFKKLLFQHTQDISPVMPLKQFQKVPFAFYGKVFLDGGWVNNYPNYTMSSELTNKLLYGVGVGLDIVTLYDLTFRFEYSYNAENEFNFFLNFSADL